LRMRLRYEDGVTLEEVHDVLDALHNVPIMLQRYGGWHVEENIDWHLTRYDGRWMGRAGSEFRRSLMETLRRARAGELPVVGRSSEMREESATISAVELDTIEARCNAATPGPWMSYVEGRDHESGSDFIMTGEGGSRREDIELTGATRADQDFIAAARQDVPRLVAEVRRLKRLLGGSGVA
jgi:hypothetical protein